MKPDALESISIVKTHIVQDEGLSEVLKADRWRLTSYKEGRRYGTDRNYRGIDRRIARRL